MRFAWWFIDNFYYFVVIAIMMSSKIHLRCASRIRMWPSRLFSKIKISNINNKNNINLERRGDTCVYRLRNTTYHDDDT